MASNNPYGLPPLPQMINNGATYQYNYHQQHQSQRISGDGEEVYRHGILRPTPQGPLQIVPQLSTLPPPAVGTGTGYNYEGFNQISLSNNNSQYDQYEYGTIPLSTQQSVSQQNGVIEENEGYSQVVENRSIEGQEQWPVNDPTTISMHNEEEISTNASFISNNPYSTSVAGNPSNQEYRSQAIGSETLGDEDPRSIEGQEQIPNDTMISSGGSVNVAQGLAYVSENRSIEGQEQIPNDPMVGSVNVAQGLAYVSENRSIEGQEQIPNDTMIGSGNSVNVAQGLTHIPVSSSIPLSTPIISSHHRSQTLGSDAMNGESKVVLSSKNTGPKSQNPASGSETGDSVGKSSRDFVDRRRQEGDSETRKSIREKRGERYDRGRRSNQRYPSFEDDDSFEDEDQERYDKRRERDWDKERKVRPKDRDRDGHWNESRREDWESASTRDSFRYYSRNDPDEDYRPRSRNSSYHDREYYYSNHRRHRRDPETHRTSSKYQREQGPPMGYVDTSSSMYGPPLRNQLGSLRFPDQYAPVAVPQKTPFQVYLERFRIENPMLYREWYHKYVNHLQDPTKIPFPPIPGYSAPHSGNKSLQKPPNISSTEPRANSGRSSAHDEMSAVGGQDDARFRPIQEPRDPSPPKRMTPQKFLTSHSIAVLTPLGHMLRVRNGGSVVEIVNMKPLMKRLPEFKEVKAFPGPLIKDVTHKNTIVQFCQRKIRELELTDAQDDKENLILLWELLILLLRQNGAAIGSDIAELLLKSKSTGRSISNSSSDERSFEDEKDHPADVVNYPSKEVEQKAIEIFCEKLLYGHKKEALDYAMDNGLWGHALFFASKMGDRTYGNVLARFANGMALNSPLQTLYQVLSGKQPASVTCCCDEAFGDWKPHLAMILSNAGQRPEVEGQAITTLGDTLGNRYHKFAAQFCYLMAEIEFSTDSKIGPLLGFIPSANNTLEATQMTEIYEFARTLGNPDFSLGTSFIQSKLEYTKTLLDLGFIQEAYSYCEEITKSLLKGRIHEREKSVAWSILQIAERLVNCDDSGSSGLNPPWIENLRKITDEVGSESTSRKLSAATSASDQMNEPSTIQTNPYDAYNPISIPNGINSENHTTPAMYTPDQAPSYTETVAPNLQWNPTLPLTNAGNSTTAPSLYDGSNIRSDPYQQPTSLQANGPPSLAHDSGSYMPNLPPYTGSYESSYVPGGMHGSGPNANYPVKKKSVHFEDEGLIADSENELEKTQLDNLTSRVMHETTAKTVKSRNAFKTNSYANLNHMFSNQNLDDHNTSDHSFNPSPAVSPIKFKSTFPIDQPINKSPRFTSTSVTRKVNKTFPIDEKCCDLNEPCEEHDSYLSDFENESQHESPVKGIQNQIYKKTDDVHSASREEQKNIPRHPSQKTEKKSGTNNKSMSLGNEQKKPKGWLSGMFSALSFKPKNQMILPDDKQPTIVWDDVTKTWKNTNGEEDEDSVPKGPPPKDSDLMGIGSSGPNLQNVPIPNPSAPSRSLPPTQRTSNNPSQPSVMNGDVGNSIGPPASFNSANKYKRPKGLSPRNNYVDVFNPNSQRTNSEPKVPLPQNGPGMPNIFMPSPTLSVADTGPANFLTTSTAQQFTNSNEGNGDEVPPHAPPMFDPSQFQNQNIHNYGLNR